MKKLTIKQKLLQDLTESNVLPTTERNNVGGVANFGKRHKSLMPVDSNTSYLTYEQFKNNLHRNESKQSDLSTYNPANFSRGVSTLRDESRLKNIKLHHIDKNQYNIRNYLSQNSPLNA